MDLLSNSQWLAPLPDFDLSISHQDTELINQIKVKIDELNLITNINNLPTQDELKLNLRNENLPYENLLDYAAKAISSYQLAEFERSYLKKRIEILDQIYCLERNLYLQQKTANQVITQIDELQKELESKASFLEGIGMGIDKQKSILAKAGANARNEKYSPLKELAEELVKGRKWKSRRQAAIDIAPKIIAEGEKIGIKLSVHQAVDTIKKWLKEKGLPAKI